MTKEDNYQVAICGSGGVGKSSVTCAFVLNLYDDEYNPTIEDSYNKRIEVDGVICNLTILDTAGQDEYEALRPTYMRASDGFVFVYDLTSTNSLHDLERFVTDVQRAKDVETFPVVMCGNKVDLGVRGDKVDQVAKELSAKLNHCKIIETSAKRRQMVDDVFVQIVRELRNGGLKKEKPQPVTRKTGLMSSVSSSRDEKSDLAAFKNAM